MVLTGAAFFHKVPFKYLNLLFFKFNGAAAGAVIVLYELNAILLSCIYFSIHYLLEDFMLLLLSVVLY
jgi:hypothetical protein